MQQQQQTDRSKLLQAAARFDSDSSGSGSGSDSDSPSRARKHSSKDSRKHSGKKRKKSSSKKHSKRDHSKRQKKRSDHEKIAELERRAAAMGAGAAAAAGGSRLPARLGFGQRGYGSSSAAASGDAVILDTSGDANNALYESLYSGDVPRYSRMDPLDLVRVSRRLGAQQLLAGDSSLGNAAADR
jgi:hypothetical protein